MFPESAKLCAALSIEQPSAIVLAACAAMAKWRADGLALGRIGVNLFPSQLGDVALLTDID